MSLLVVGQQSVEQHRRHEFCVLLRRAEYPADIVTVSVAEAHVRVETIDIAEHHVGHGRFRQRLDFAPVHGFTQRTRELVYQSAVLAPEIVGLLTIVAKQVSLRLLDGDEEQVVVLLEK